MLTFKKTQDPNSYDIYREDCCIGRLDYISGYVARTIFTFAGEQLSTPEHHDILSKIIALRKLSMMEIGSLAKRKA